MSKEPEPLNGASYLGADNLSTIVGAEAKKHLKKLLDRQPTITIPDFSKPVEHEKYLELRDKITTSTTLAAASGDESLDTLLKQWISLQQGYAKQVIQTIKGGVGDQEELLRVADRELADGEADREAYRTLGRTPVAEMDDEGLARFKSLKERVGQLDRTVRERERWHRAVAGVSRVEQTLTTLIENGIESIHYVIPSVKEIQERLGDNKYDGPDFQPFSVSTSVSVTDMFMRNVTTADIRTATTRRDLEQTDLHPILVELAVIYDYVRTQKPGTVIIPSDIVDSLKLKEIGAKGMASYFEDHEKTFGVQSRERKAGSRTFVRKDSGATLDRRAFLAYMTDGNLQHTNAKEVNEYYLQRTLALMRETPEAYLGFTKHDVQRLAVNNRLPVGHIYIARNMTTRATELGLKTTSQDGEEKYVFSRVIPTERQTTYVREAVDTFGISRFTPDDVAGKVSELHKGYRLLPRVAEAALRTHHEGWGYRVASSDPLQYQKKDRSSGGPAQPQRGDRDRIM